MTAMLLVHSLRRGAARLSPMETDPIEAQCVVVRLEAAGGTEMAMREGGCWPAGYRGYWPDMQAEWLDRADPDAPPSKPDLEPREIAHMDLVATWITSALMRPEARTIVHLRKLVWWRTHPRAGESVMSWEAIGRRVHRDARWCEAQWEPALDRLALWWNYTRLGRRMPSQVDFLRTLGPAPAAPREELDEHQARVAQPEGIRSAVFA